MRIGQLAGIGVAVLLGVSARAETLRLVTEDVPPINTVSDKPGEAGGIATDLIAKALAESRVSFDVSVHSWTDAYAMALHGRDVCVYSTSRTDERETLFKWVGPIVRNRWALFGRIDGPALASLDDARGHSIGGPYDGAPTRYLKGIGFAVDETTDFHTNLRRVEARQIDYAVSSLLTGAHAIAHDKELADIVPVLVFKDIDLYLACNKSVSDKLVARLNGIFQRMTEDGTVAATLRHYQ
jgi:polar amino acid transport system substrate-binding protein